MTHSKKEELLKDEWLFFQGTKFKPKRRMALFPRHKVQAFDRMRVKHLRVQRNYLPEEKYWEPDLLTESFTVSLSGGPPVFCWVIFVCLLFGTVFVVFVLCLVFSLFSMWCTRSSLIPRFSPSSWWAQHWSKKKSMLTASFWSTKLIESMFWNSFLVDSQLGTGKSESLTSFPRLGRFRTLGWYLSGCQCRLALQD